MLYNGLHIQSTAYNAATNTPDITQANGYSAAIYQVTTAGYQAGITVTGATVTGGGSYLMLGDMVMVVNGTYQLLSNAIVTGGQTISVGATPFTTLAKANAYLNQRTYTSVTLQLTASTTETASVDVQNLCGGALTIDGNGFIVDFSGTASTNMTVSGSNVTLNDFSVKANYATEFACVVRGDVTHNNGLTVQNTNGDGLKIDGGKLQCETTNAATPLATSNVTIIGLATSNYTFLNLSGKFSCNNLTVTNGIVSLATNAAEAYVLGNIAITNGNYQQNIASTIRISGNINTNGGTFNAGTSCSNYFGGAVTTGGGIFNAGIACNNIFNGAVTALNSSSFGCHLGITCSNLFGSTLTSATGVATLYFGGTSQSYFQGLVTGRYSGSQASTAYFNSGTGSIIGLPAASISGLQY